MSAHKVEFQQICVATNDGGVTLYALDLCGEVWYKETPVKGGGEWIRMENPYEYYDGNGIRRMK